MPDPAAPPPRWLLPLGLLLGLLAALGVALPDRAALATNLPGYFNNDGAQAVYLHDAVHDALLAGRLDLFDPNQFWPVGISYAPINGGNILEMLVSGFFRLFLPWPFWLSVASYAWITLNTLAALPLGWHLWRRAAPTLAAALCWGLLPVHLGQLAAGRLTQLALVGLPLAVLGLLRISEEDHPRNAWLAGLGMALTAAGYWFYAIFLCILAPLFLLHGARLRPVRPLFHDTGRAALIALAGMAPGLLVIALGAARAGGAPDDALDAATMSPLFPDALQLENPQPKGLQGWFPLVFAPGLLFTLWRGQRRGLWLGAAALALIFALGPAQQALGRTWLLPAWLLWKGVPGFDRMLHPDRWVSVAGLFLVIGAVDGLARWRPLATVALPIGLLIQLIAGGALPLGSYTLRGGELWRAVAEDPQRGALIVLPLLQAPMTCSEQPFHGRALLGGMVENQPWFHPPEWTERVNSNTVLLDLWRISRGKAPQHGPYQADLDRLRADGFDTLVLDNASWRLVGELVGRDGERLLSDYLGPPARRFADGALWRLPSAGLPGAPPDRDERIDFMGPPGPDPKARGGGLRAPGTPPGPPPPAPPPR